MTVPVDMSDEEYAEVRIAYLEALLASPRTTHAIAEGYQEVPIWT